MRILTIGAQNATIRENICFGRPFEEERYWAAVKSACLEPDLEILPNGDLTEVGEKVFARFFLKKNVVLTYAQGYA
jgi:ABC-type transport system involved in Fe-S cluster assembly fused permease/ATPase subunit